MPVLGPLDFALAPGQRLAVVGESGCGKSTLLHVLAGLLAPPAGEVLVDGRVVAAADLGARGAPGCRSGHAAYMFQRDLLLPWKTVLANAVFAAQVAGRAAGGRGRDADVQARARTILEEFGLGDALEALPRQLSGGMRQRVALARTLVLRVGPRAARRTVRQPGRSHAGGAAVLAARRDGGSSRDLDPGDARRARGGAARRPGGRARRADLPVLEGWVSVPFESPRSAAVSPASRPARPRPTRPDLPTETLRRLTTEVRGQLARGRSTS